MLVQFLGQYFQELFNLTNAMAPYLLLGFLFAGILHVFFKKEQVARLLGSKKVKSSFYASLIGVPLPLCSCGVIPTGISIYRSGASKGSTVSFLISTPQTGADSIFATYSMLGLPFAILRPFIAFVSGIVGGSITNYLDKNSEEETTDAFVKENEKESKNPVSRMLHYAFVESIEDIAKWLIIGLLLAALISVFLPAEFFQTYITNDLISMVIILAVAIPLYICATGSIPIAAVLIMKGISPGAALVFLMAGPATNAATITVLGKVLGRRTLISYLVSIIGSAIVFGILVDNFLPREWFTAFIGHNHQHQHGLPFWLELSSSVALTILIGNIYIKKLVSKFKKPSTSYSIDSNLINDSGLLQENSANLQIFVKGMNCNKCKANVEQSIKSLEKVTNVIVYLEKSLVVVEGNDIKPEEIKKKVEDIGYEYGGVVP